MRCSRPLSLAFAPRVAGAIFVTSFGVAIAAAGCSAGVETAPPAITDAQDGGGDRDARSGDRVDARAIDAVVEPPADAGDATSDAAAEHDAADADPGLQFDCTPADAATIDHPIELACTGLYKNWPLRSIDAARVRAYDPGIHLWSDGAEKSRWISLPPNTRIDTTDMDEWTFPSGTKLWKEFRLAGKPVETRFMWKRAPGDWFRTTYRWSVDGSSATEVVDGVLQVWGTTYEIPPQSACATCHAGRIDNVLGYEVVGLASSAASGFELATLVREGRLTSPPLQAPVIPGNATERAALGWLHANCGNACHNASPSSFAGTTGLWMRLSSRSMATVAVTDTFRTAVNVASNFQPFPDAGFLRIKARDIARSAIPFRVGTRDDQGQGFQMPPLATHLIDTQGLQMIEAWVNALPP